LAICPPKSDAALDWNSRHAQDVGDFGFLEARSVVFEGEAIELFVDAEAAQAVGVCELTEGSELLGAKRALQFVGNFDESHAVIIARPSDEAWRTAASSITV